MTSKSGPARHVVKIENALSTDYPASARHDPNMANPAQMQLLQKMIEHSTTASIEGGRVAYQETQAVGVRNKQPLVR